MGDLKIQTRLTLILAALGIGVIASTIGFGLLSSNQTIPNNGIVKTVNVSVYEDSTLTRKVTVINWGNLGPGTTTNRTVYVSNSGTAGLTLTMTTNNWNTANASKYIKMRWNRQSYLLPHESSVQAVLSLLVPSNVTGVEGFSFDIIVTGTET
jgi:hypothetical protein